MKLRHLLLAASVVVLTACATTTPYREASKIGSFDGFSQQLIENDRARVSFAGNSLTEKETVENYLIFRAAELALENGFETFTLTERDTERNTRLRSTGGSSFNNGFNNSRFFGWSGRTRFSSFGNRGFNSFGGRGFNSFGSRGFGGGFNNRIDVREITKYRATAEVKFGGFGSAGEDDVFNAREVIENLGPTIVYPEVKA